MLVSMPSIYMVTIKQEGILEDSSAHSSSSQQHPDDPCLDAPFSIEVHTFGNDLGNHRIIGNVHNRVLLNANINEGSFVIKHIRVHIQIVDPSSGGQEITRVYCRKENSILEGLLGIDTSLQSAARLSQITLLIRKRQAGSNLQVLHSSLHIRSIGTQPGPSWW